MNTWIISDTHFFDKGAERANGWPMDYVPRTIYNWKRKVGAGDITIHLGDITASYENLKGMLDAVPGRKIAILGNHDEKDPQWYMQNGFQFACKELVLPYRGMDLLLTHEPQREVRIPKVGLNICGHLHENDPAKFGYAVTSRHRIFSIERNNFCPATLEEVISANHLPHWAA